MILDDELKEKLAQLPAPVRNCLQAMKRDGELEILGKIIKGAADGLNFMGLIALAAKELDRVKAEAEKEETHGTL